MEAIKIALSIFGLSIIIGLGLAVGIDFYQVITKRTFISLAINLASREDSEV